MNSQFMSPEKYSELIGLVYDVAFSSMNWDEFLDRFSGYIGVRFSMMCFVNKNCTERDLFYVHNIPERWQPFFFQYCKYLCNSSSYLSEMPEGVMRLSHDFSPGSIIEGEITGLESLLSSEVAFTRMGAFVCRYGEQYLFFSMSESSCIENPNEEVQRIINLILPHIMRSVMISSKMVEMSNRSILYKDIINRINAAVILTDHLGRVVLSNNKADEMLNNSDDLFVNNSLIKLKDNGETRALYHFICQASRRDSAASTKIGAMTVERESMQSPMRIVVTPVLTNSIPELFGGCAMLFVTENESNIALPNEVVMSLYGLTYAEARLATALAKGLGLDDVAAEFRLSKNTLRSQLYAIYTKIGIKRQNELVNLMVAGPACFASH